MICILMEAAEYLKKLHVDNPNIKIHAFSILPRMNPPDFVEKYQDEAAVEAHKNSEHFQTFVPMMNAFREGPSEVTKCVTIDI